MTSTARRVAAGAAAVIAALALAGCANVPPAPPAPAEHGVNSDGIVAAFVVRGSGEQAQVRVVTTGVRCPELRIDGGPLRTMAVRAAPGVVPPRDGGNAAAAVRFDVLSCEAALPIGTQTASVGAHRLALPAADIRRIVVIGDTGCRMKHSDKAFQACNDPVAWPFAAVAAEAATMRPDLVVHVGDIHYRESPCPAGMAGCANSPWGYGSDSWEADLFRPAAPLLAAAPWIFVRGNHESCGRAGQGWFRFVDAGAWSEQRSCNDPANDDDADFSKPYAVRLSADSQFIVFDSSRTGTNAYRHADLAYRRYQEAMAEVERLVGQATHSLFLNHHPILGFAPKGTAGALYPGNAGLQSVLGARNPQRYLPAGIDAALHGHVHLFEAIDFASDHPATLVMGNSGSQKDKRIGDRLPDGATPAAGAVVAHFTSHDAYGFTTLDKAPSGWDVTAWSVSGQALVRCAMVGAKLDCRKLSAP